MALGQAPALAATINVTTNVPDINGADGLCSLIEAIDNANDNSTGSVHTHCTAGTLNGTDTIELPAGSTQTLTTVNYSGSGLPAINTSITIEGHNSTIERAGSAPNFRIFFVRSELSLNQTTVSGGQAVGPDARGGGIENLGTVTLNNSTVSGNGVSVGGGVHNAHILNVTNSRISGNTANRGGGVYTRYRTATTLNNSTISGNSAANGGGVYNYGVVTLANSTVSGNSAGGSGGGVSADPSYLTLVRALVVGNAAPTGAEVSGGASSPPTTSTSSATVG